MSVGVGVDVGVFVGTMSVGVGVDVGVLVGTMFVGVGVDVGVLVGTMFVGVAVDVGVLVGTMSVGVAVDVGVLVETMSVGVAVDVGVAVSPTRITTSPLKLLAEEAEAPEAGRWLELPTTRFAEALTGCRRATGCCTAAGACTAASPPVCACVSFLPAARAGRFTRLLEMLSAAIPESGPAVA
jgi:hypothetical protein